MSKGWTTFAPTFIMRTRYVEKWMGIMGKTFDPSSVKCFQMYVPNGVGAFGSTYKEIEDLDEGWNFFLTKTRWKYLDRPTHRCSGEMRYAS